MFGEVGAVLEFGFEDEDVGDRCHIVNDYVLHVNGFSDKEYGSKLLIEYSRTIHYVETDSIRKLVCEHYDLFTGCKVWVRFDVTLVRPGKQRL